MKPFISTLLLALRTVVGVKALSKLFQTIFKMSRTFLLNPNCGQYSLGAPSIFTATEGPPRNLLYKEIKEFKKMLSLKLTYKIFSQYTFTNNVLK